MIVTIDTDKEEIVIEKATVQEIYEYIAKFGLLDYSITSAKTPATPKPYIKKGTIQPPHYSKGTDFDIDKHFKLYYNII